MTAPFVASNGVIISLAPTLGGIDVEHDTLRRYLPAVAVDALREYLGAPTVMADPLAGVAEQLRIANLLAYANTGAGGTASQQSARTAAYEALQIGAPE